MTSHQVVLSSLSVIMSMSIILFYFDIMYINKSLFLYVVDNAIKY